MSSIRNFGASLFLFLLLIENVSIYDWPDKMTCAPTNIMETTACIHYTGFNPVVNDAVGTPAFDFKKVLFENISLTAWVTNINYETGNVAINGVDTQRPSIPFTWDWGDGTTYEGWFPQTHIYLNRKRNYIVKITAHYSNGKTDSTKVLIHFVPFKVTFVPLPSNFSVVIPNSSVGLISRMVGYSVPKLTYFNDSFFNTMNRSAVEYVLTVAASIQMDFANYNTQVINGNNIIILRDPSFTGMYALWYTSPVAIGAGDYAFKDSIQWSSLFHEIGHCITLNSPANYCYGGKIDGPANAIFSETMAQIFQHSTAYELINRAKEYGLNEDLVFEIEQSALNSMLIVRRAYENYISSGMKFNSWNNPNTPEDETFNTFMTIVYKFFVYAENSGMGYRIPLKRMMTLLQTFQEKDRERYGSTNNSQEAETFRSTLLVAALSYAFEKDLRADFRKLNFPIDDNTFDELITRVSASLPTEYEVKVSSDRGTVSGSGWYKAGTNATVTISPTQIEKDPFTNYVFEGWKVNETIVSTSPTYSFVVNKPISLTASWRTELKITNILIILGPIMLIVVLAAVVLKRKGVQPPPPKKDIENEIKKYEEYLNKLEQLKKEGKISEQAYKKLREEYEKKLEELVEKLKK